MRVLGRVLLGTLAIVFAMVLVARLIRRRRAHARRRAHPGLPRTLPAAPSASLNSPSRTPSHPQSHPKRPGVYLAAQPGGSGWGRLVVPPSSPSRALRRRGRQGPLGAARSYPRAGRGRLPGAAAL